MMSFVKSRIRVPGDTVGVFGKALLGLWTWTLRFHVRGEERYRELRKNRRPTILLIWHGRIFPAPYFFRKRGMMPLVSPSGDGEILARILHRWGYKVLRGSGSHSVVDAWKAMTQELRSGGELIMVPDGPKGPAGKLKAGCLKLASETGAAIVPVAIAASRGKHLTSWDRFLIPRPFTQIAVILGPAFDVAPGLRGGALEDERLKIEDEMLRLEAEADRICATPKQRSVN